MRAKIKEKREVAKGTLFVTFDLLGEEVDFVAGQYFWVELLDPPYDDDKRSLAELPVGSDVDVEQPKGNFLLPSETERPFVFVGGGIGITVFRSMLLYITEEGLPHRVTLVYSNRDPESTAFLDELQELAQGHPNIRLVLTMTDDESWDGEKRHIDADLLRDHLDDGLNDYRYLVAGPPPMTEAVVDKLKEAGIPEDQIAADRFSGY